MKFNFLERISGDFSVFRDDLYPFLGGGNKGRKMDTIAREIYKKNANAIVTTGGIQSNHCRAVAIFAAQNHIECTLVLHGSKKDFEEQSGNAKIMRLSGAHIIFVDEPNQISNEMDAAMNAYNSDGFKPYYIYGGGHTFEGGLAYIEAIGDLKEYNEKNNWAPDYIFVASGTGSTQSGIMAGLDKYAFENTIVVGISVGRRSEYASKIVDDFYLALCTHYDISCSRRKTIVLDDYLCGGYGKYTDELKEFSLHSIKKYGFSLDMCYTGKAFYGMLDYIKKNSLNDKKILFWHTGGIFNFLAE